MVRLIPRATHCQYRGCLKPLSDAREHQGGKDYCCVLCAERGLKYDRERAAPPELQLVSSR